MSALPRCPKCGGLQVEEGFDDCLGAHVWRLWGIRCVNCGRREFGERVMNKRIQARVPQSALYERSQSK